MVTFKSRIEKVWARCLCIPVGPPSLLLGHSFSLCEIAGRTEVYSVNCKGEVGVVAGRKWFPHFSLGEGHRRLFNSTSKSPGLYSWQNARYGLIV